MKKVVVFDDWDLWWDVIDGDACPLRDTLGIATLGTPLCNIDGTKCLKPPLLFSLHAKDVVRCVEEYVNGIALSDALHPLFLV